MKNDPRLVVAACELRDRWLERVNSEPLALLPRSKYEVSKELAAPAVKVVTEISALPSRIAA